MNTKTNNSPYKLIIGMSIIALLFTSVLFLKPTAKVAVPDALKSVLWPEPRQLSAFDLTLDSQKQFNLEHLTNKWTLLFFGYTNCPDVCPMALSAMKAVFNNLEQHPETQAKTQFVFVSVDPKRDLPEHTSKYVAHFDESFIGATGNNEQITNITRQFSAGYIIEEADEKGDYEVNHTSSLYLIGPEQQIHGAFNPPLHPDIITSQYLQILNLRDTGQLSALRQASDEATDKSQYYFGAATI